MTNEHAGDGGMLEQHEAFVKAKGQKQSMLGWAKLKGERRRLANGILQMGCNLILCYRAKERIDIDVTPPKKLGWMPVGGAEFLWDMSVSALLKPGCDGYPDWRPERPGEREMVKLPDHFREILQGKQLSEDIGEAMARWASGSVKDWTFPKGEHQGKTMAEAPDRYLVDLLDKGIPDALREKVEAEMEKRMGERADEAQSEVCPAADGNGD